MAETFFTGPVRSGTVKDTTNAGTANTGLGVLHQTVTMLHNGASTRDVTITIPANAYVVDLIYDVITAHAGSSAFGITAGSTAGGTEYAPSTNVFAGGRFRPTFTVANLAAIDPISASTQSVVLNFRGTPTGTSSGGENRITVLYVQV